MTAKKPVPLWVPGDWNALFGLGTNVLVNLLVMTGLLKFVLQMPDEITFGRILPAVGLSVLGNGAILTGLVLGAIVVFIIERKLATAAAFAVVGAVLTYFGFMHGEAVGIGESGLGVTPSVTLGYLLVAGFLYACARLPALASEQARTPPATDLAPEMEGASGG